ncbi:MAG TPA: hypothetical protein VMH90_01610, partial [Thermoplasmata archaeon]|nr:hypothetical protein [Thermoplasmata archaeon]
MRIAPGLRGVLLVAVVLLATGGIGLLPGTPAAALFGPSGHAAPHGHGLSPGWDARAGPLGPAGAPALGSPAGDPGRCAILSARYASLYPGPALPPSLAPSWSGGCAIGSDEAGLGLLSNASESGARAHLTIHLPDAAGGASRGLLAYEVRMWVSGVPCSVDGAALLSVDLIPPNGGVAPSGAANWSVWAPVYDLVPAGGCDPTCQNATALFTL